MTPPEPLTIPETFDCVDLSCNSTRYDPTTNAHKSHVSTGPYNELVFVHSSHNSVGRRFGFGKNSRDGRKHHRQHFRRDEPHSCFVCGKTFSRVGNLRIHQRCHTGEKPYCCLQCGRCFSQAGDLKKHKRVHTGEKPYYCGQCGKSFSRGENLKRHQKIHIGETLHLQQAWRDQHPEWYTKMYGYTDMSFHPNNGSRSQSSTVGCLAPAYPFELVDTAHYCNPFFNIRFGLLTSTASIQWREMLCY
uniref:C2H2-type domain-containing protein n=1 Tax=Oncorhynchus kisutch TaxID=8019 RepID=A0A8C7H1H5_ONCKI